MSGSWLMAPLRGPFAALARKSAAEMARLIHRGRLEERVSRLLAREVADESVAQVLEYVSDKPEVRRLIQVQGTSLAGEVVEEMRDRSAAAGTLLESLVRRLLKRAPP